MKRLIPLILATAMLLSFAACKSESPSPSANAPGGNSQTPATVAPGNSETPAGESENTPAGLAKPTTATNLSPSDPTEFRVWLTTSFAAPATKNKISDLLKEETGVSLKYEIVSESDAETQIGAMIAGGVYPDLIGTKDLKRIFLTSGALIPIDEYLDSGVAPNLAEHIQPYRTVAGFEGKFYIPPSYNRFYGELTGGMYYGPGFFIQKGVLADAGYPEVKSLDDYFNIIEGYYNKNPKQDGLDTIGFLICAAQGKEFPLTNAPAHLTGHPNDGEVYVDDNIAKIHFDTDFAKAYYKKLNEMNAKGLIDKGTFALTYEDYLAKVAQGNVLGMFDQYWNFQRSDEALLAEKRYERTYVATQPVFDGYKPWYMDRDVMNVNQGFGISVSCKNPDKAVDFLNLMLDEVWQKRLAWGIEGEDYYVNEDGRYLRTREQVDNYENLLWKASNRLEALLDLLPKHQGVYSDGNAYAPEVQPEEFQKMLSDYDRNFLQTYGKATWRSFLDTPPDNPLYYPCWDIALKGEVRQASIQLKEVGVQNLSKIILAPVDQFETLWTEYLAAIGKVNVKLFEDFINQKIQERIETKLSGG